MTAAKAGKSTLSNELRFWQDDTHPHTHTLSLASTFSASSRQTDQSISRTGRRRSFSITYRKCRWHRTWTRCTVAASQGRVRHSPPCPGCRSTCWPTPPSSRCCPDVNKRPQMSSLKWRQWFEHFIILSSDVRGLASDVNSLASDISGLASDVSSLSSDVSSLASDVSGLASDVSGLSSDVSGLDT